MTRYAKLFEHIVRSTIWGEKLHTKIVWITLLAIKDKHGEVLGSIPGLAQMAGVTIEQCEEALERLKSPDKYSRTKDFEGRRIEEIDGGWFILNAYKYNKMKSKEDELEKTAVRVQRFRDREKAKVTQVTQSNAMKHHETQNSTDVDVSLPLGTTTTMAAPPSAPLLPEVVNGKPYPNGRRSKKFEIPGLGFSQEMEAEFNRIWQAWPSQGWNFTSKAPSPRRINRALAMRRFKEILDNCPHEIDKRRIAASDLVDSALAFIAKRKAESPGAIPNVPCIANFFSSEEVSKKQWQDALMEFFGETV